MTAVKKFILFSLLMPVVLFLVTAGGAGGTVSEGSAAAEAAPVESAAFLPLSEEPLNGHWEFHPRVPDLAGVAGVQLRTQHHSRLHPARFCGDCPAVGRFLRLESGGTAGFRGVFEAVSPCPVRLAAAVEARAGPCA